MRFPVHFHAYTKVYDAQTYDFSNNISHKRERTEKDRSASSIKSHRRLRLILFLLIAVFFYFLLTVHLIYKPPIFVINGLKKQFPDVLWKAETKSPVFAWTFDDSPSQHTEKLIELLDRYNQKATFFIIGSQLDIDHNYKNVLIEAVKAGHELGNHAMNDEPTRKLAQDEVHRQILAVDEQIEDIYAKANQIRKNKFFRPGSGLFSAPIIETCKFLNYTVVLGNVYPHDPFLPYPKLNANHVLSSLSTGSIVINHDRREWCIPQTLAILEALSLKNLRSVTLSDLIQL